MDTRLNPSKLFAGIVLGIVATILVFGMKAPTTFSECLRAEAPSTSTEGQVASRYCREKFGK